MKNFCFLFLIILLASCSGNEGFDGENYGLLESKAEVGDPLEGEWDLRWVQKEKRAQLVHSILEKAKMENDKVFYYLPGEMLPFDKNELQQLFKKNDSIVDVRNGEIEKIVYKNELDPDGIVYLKFKEELIWDEGSNSMIKKIRYVCPMEKTFEENGELRGYKGLFWLKVD